MNEDRMKGSTITSDSHMSDQHLSEDQLVSLSDLEIHPALTELSGKTFTEKSIACITESRGAATEIGIAVFNFSTGICNVYQILDTPTFAYTIKLLIQHDATLIIYNASTLHDHYQSKLTLQIIEMFPSEMLIPAQRGTFNSDDGKKFISAYCIQSKIDIILDSLDQRYYATSAIGALFQQLKIMSSLGLHTLDFSIECPKDFMMIDHITSQSLELVSSKSTDEKGCLLAVIDKTKTKMGSRLLRNRLLQPITNTDEIKSTHSNVKFLLSEGSKLEDLVQLLSEFPDIDRLIAGLIRIQKSESTKIPERNVKLIIDLHHLLKLTIQLHMKILDENQPAEFKHILNKIDMNAVRLLLGELDSILSPDTQTKRKSASSQSSRCYAIKEGIDVLLDVARKTLKETTDDIYEYSEALSKNLDIPMSLKYTPEKGFSLTLLKNVESQKVPDGFFVQSRIGENFSCSTLELMKLNHRIRESLEEIFLISNKLIFDLLEKAKALIHVLYQLSNAIGIIDFTTSIAIYTESRSFVFPEFGPALALKDVHNHVLESMRQSVGNDVFCSPGHEFNLISGINMSGKSTYLKTIAINQILSQIGYPLMCSYASIKPMNAIFTRFGSDDDLKTGCSSFLKELKEVSHCIECIDGDSLVLIDEFGRGTSLADGLSLSAAIAEELLNRKVSVFMVTHYQRLVAYLETIPSVNLLSFQVAEWKGVFDYSFKAKQGASSITDYGIKLSEQMQLPTKIVAKAYEIKRRLEASGKDNIENQLILNRKVQKRRLIIETAANLRSSDLLDHQRQELRSEFFAKLQKISQS